MSAHHRVKSPLTITEMRTGDFLAKKGLTPMFGLARVERSWLDAPQRAVALPPLV